MNILSLNFEKTWQNGEQQTVDTAVALEEFFKHKITLICRKGFPLERAALAAGLETISFARKRDVFYYLKQNGKSFDIIHPETAQMLTYCVLTKYSHKRKIVYTRRLDIVPQGIITLWKYKKADSLIATNTQIERILNLQGLQKTCVIPDMIMPKKLSLDKAIKIFQKHNISLDKKFVIGTISAFEPQKSPETMVQAIEELYKKRNDFVFVHFGAGSLLEQTNALIEAKNLKNVYYTPGQIEPPDDLFAILNVFAISSTEEGFGNIILDAFMYGVPVASTLAVGVNELILPFTAHHSEQRGISVPVGDYKALANAMDELLSNNAERQFFADNAMKYVFDYYSPEVVAAKYNELFIQLINHD